MNHLYPALFLALIVLGAIILLIVSWREKKRQMVDKYLLEQKEKGKATESLMAWLDHVVPASLAQNEAEINQKMINAGVYSFAYSHLYLPLKLSVMLIGCGVLFFLFYVRMETHLIVTVSLLSCWVIIILIVPDAVLDARVQAYRLTISRRLPYLIDLIAVCVQTGMTIEASMSYLAKEMSGFDPKLAKLVSRTNERARIIGLDKALDELYAHIPTSEMRSFVMTLKQSLQYGSSIYETLVTLSSDIRQVSMLTVEEKIGKLAAKMSVPLILFIMLPIVILIAVPGVMRLMSGA
ncbi:Bacterial type II secretion system protein F domain protein [Vibrio aerogenes CECT 7868]|uniref:Bacterial type II secretion system protein F domain protein n=1 Tax=Vibrio aerogenes CECT 7868 TaxID=1216006 RepID=A0A1M5ZRG4_9VIBR|nr:type II secretion system F family protein [Vibrio aerogenes]SHI26791.1 Bacterial type II secretion system protein F domain protein [Vibrio aerogenes CECT 7868]